MANRFSNAMGGSCGIASICLPRTVVLCRVHAVVAIRQTDTSGIEKGGREVTAARRIFAFLRRNVGKAYCEDCLAALCDLNTPEEAASAARQFERTGEFVRNPGDCSFCSRKIKTVIGAISTGNLS